MQATMSDTQLLAGEQEVKRRRRFGGIFGNYYVRRIARAIFTIWLVSTLIFFLVRLLPGNPVDVFVNQQMQMYGYSKEEAENMARSLFAIDLSAPKWQQYLDYMAGLVQGDLGQSITAPGTSVSSVIQSRIWWTLFSVGTSLFLAFTIGCLIGMIMAYKRGGWLDNVMSTLASILGSIPNYQLALMLIVLLGVRWKVIPFTQMRGAISPGQKVEPTWAFFEDVLFHAAMPILVYVITSIGGWMLSMKASTVAALDEDYVTAARARGIPEWRVLLFYVGRNAILPLFTSLTIGIGFVFGGSLLVEPIFQYQGMGLRLFDAINKRDYTTMQGLLLVTVTSVIVALLVADLLLSRIDPRIGSKG